MKQLTFLLLICFGLATCKSNLTSTLRGKILNAPFKKIYLADSYNWELLLDSSIIENDEFEFKITSRLDPNKLYSLEYFNENRIRSIEIKNNFLYDKSKRAYLNSFIIDTSYIGFNADFSKSPYLDIQAGMENKAYYNTQLINFGYLDPDSNKANIQVDIYLSIIDKHPNSIYLMNQINANRSTISKKRIETIIQHFSKSIMMKDVAKNLIKYADEKDDSEVLENAIMENRTGNETTIITPGSKVNMLIFWASWCAPCIKEIPIIKKLHNEYGSIGLRISSISIDDDKSAWDQALKKETMPWKQLIVPQSKKEEVKNKFEIGSIPYIIFTNGNGKVLAKTIGIDKNSENEYRKIIDKNIK
jgi:thiol-disulfide isomerase/thioredoxin